MVEILELQEDLSLREPLSTELLRRTWEWDPPDEWWATESPDEVVIVYRQETDRGPKRAYRIRVVEVAIPGMSPAMWPESGEVHPFGWPKT